MSIEKISSNKCYGGEQHVFRHASKFTGTPMEFAVYLPPSAARGAQSPALIYLSGLTCTWENVTVKAGAQQYCARAGIIFVAPDTSPRGDEVPNDSAYDLGQGAGFYLNATKPPWSNNYKMESYIAEELLEIIADQLPVERDSVGLTGHSMGGHGALTLAMKHPDKFKSVSAFSPITNPANCPWGRKAFSTYLGDDESAWQEHDACKLVESRGWKHDILIDQGQADEFLAEQLKPWEFDKACRNSGVALNLRMHAGYDHSYYFIDSFMRDHVAWHLNRLRG